MFWLYWYKFFYLNINLMQLGFKVRSFVLELKSPTKRGSLGSSPRGVIASDLTFAGTARAISIPMSWSAWTNSSSPCSGMATSQSQPASDAGEVGCEGDDIAGTAESYFFSLKLLWSFGLTTFTCETHSWVVLNSIPIENYLGKRNASWRLPLFKLLFLGDAIHREC